MPRAPVIPAEGTGREPGSGGLARRERRIPDSRRLAAAPSGMTGGARTARATGTPVIQAEGTGTCREPGSGGLAWRKRRIPDSRRAGRRLPG
jgi:hypothetical protein